ncbi:DNA-directed RNA polymerase subunit omega [Haloactinopolyspora alba]|uniref:DNA-directed RNA polymerase subunit omega n=1 Tax=Haloactinopolyspora alba TaxID=648780 RepID=UPI000D0D214A
MSVSGTQGVAEGITHPPIDDLLAKTDSKYSLVIYAAKRARQINAYYSQLGEGLLEYVGPLVETHVQEKPLSIAMREIEAGLLTAEQVDPSELTPADVRPGTPATSVAVEAIEDTDLDADTEQE